MSYHTDRMPDEGDLGVVTDLHSYLGTRHTELRSTVTALAQALGDLDSDAWEGESGTQWRSSLAAPRSRLGAVRARLSDVRPPLAAYIAGVEDLGTRAAPWRSRLDDAEEILRMLWLFPDYTGGRYAPDEGVRDRIRQDLCEEALHEQDQAWSALRELHEERRSLDGVLCDALRAGEPEGWDDLHAALLRAGVTCADDVSPDEIAAAISSLGSRVASGDGSEQDVRDLQTLFDAWGDDHDVMARTFLALGGHDTAALVDRLGNGVTVGDLEPALALGLAQSVRAGLSNGSARWSPAVASSFADGLVDGSYRSAVGFLFGDAKHAPLGETLAVAVADLVDRIERDPANPGNGSSWDTTPMAGGRTLAMLEDEGSFARVDDFAGRVLETLGEYPDAALDWLTDPEGDPYGDGELGADRVDYWFGERDWSAETSGDGFEGPSALWAGAQRATGSLLDPHSEDPDVQRAVADLSHRVFGLLSGHEQLVPDNVSARGSVELARAIGQQLPQLAEYPLSLDAADNSPQRAGILGGPDAWIANPDRDSVADLLGVAGYHQGGHDVLAATTSQYQQAVVAYAGSPDAPLSGAEAIDRLLAMQGAMEGAPVGAHLATGAAHDQQVRDALDDATSLVGLVPLPGGTLGGFATGEAVGWVADTLGDRWATEYNEALAAEYGNEEARESLMRERLESIIDTYVEHGVLEAPRDRVAYVNGLIDEYHDEVDAAAREAERGER